MPSSERLTTELEAINTMLSCVGESPINTLLGDLPAGIQVAVDLLRDTSRKIQLKGWHFNTEEDYELSRSATDGTVTLPGNAIDVDLTVEDSRVDLVARGLRLYDRLNHTYVFTFNPRCTLTWFLAWTDLPETAREYIKVKSARIFQDQTVGSTEHHRYSSGDELEALVGLQSSNTENEDATIFDSRDMASIVNRRRPQISQF